MELAASLYEVLCTPLAAHIDIDHFLTETEFPVEPEISNADSTDDEYEPDIQWRVDGCALGVQLFATPIFLESAGPLRVDVLLPDQRDQSPAIRRHLQSSSLCYERTENVSLHPLVRHVTRGLSRWAKRHANFAKTYLSLPFGSHIVIPNFNYNPSDMEIHFSPEYDIEWQMLSPRALEQVWQSRKPRIRMPAELDLSELKLIRQLQDSVSLVRILNSSVDRIFVFKSSTRGFYYVYNELFSLISMPSHPNIMSAPEYIVTKSCYFGGKIGVCGFLLPYYELGSLSANVGRIREEGEGAVYRIAEQVCRALLYLQEKNGSYYSDLRPDNILLEGEGRQRRAILIDFEQRGNWSTWAAPEISYLSYFVQLVRSHNIPDVEKAHYASLLEQANCEVNLLGEGCSYTLGNPGCNEVWNSIPACYWESVTVYSLGKLLWCLFEGVWRVSNLDCLYHLGYDYGEIEFPEFRKTPEPVQELILRCTAGAPEHEGRFTPVVRIGGKAYPRPAPHALVNYTADSRTILEASKIWWQDELEKAEKEIRERLQWQEQNGCGPDATYSYHDRPTLREILRWLQQAIISQGL